MRNRLISSLSELNFLTKEDRDRYEDLFNDKFGIVNAILERNDLRKYGFYMYQCLTSKTQILFELNKEVSSGGLGISKNQRIAFLSCFGEAIERYCMSFCNEKDILSMSWRDINPEHKINNYHLYSNQQYKTIRQYKNPLKNLFHWVSLNSFNNNYPEIYWPASLIYLPFKYSPLASETSSTGVSTHTTELQSIMSGTMELIERDAVMLNIISSLNPPSIKLSSVRGDNEYLIKKISKNYKIKILKLYSDINIPIYLAYIWRSNKNYFHFGIGACADLNSDYAIEKALKECLFTYLYSKDIMDLKPENPNQISALYEHFLYYQEIEKFDQLFNFRTHEEDYQPKVISWDELLESLTTNKLKLYYKNLTTKDITKYGITVTKSVIPSLIDVNKSHLLPRKGASRFASVPHKLGLPHSINFNLPHPFP